MLRIFKYPFGEDLGVLDAVKLPRNAKVVLVAEQNGVPTIWAVVDHEEGTAPALRTYRLFGTGQVCPPADQHVGSVVCGNFTWHIFKDE